MTVALKPIDLAQAIQKNFANLTVEALREYIADDCVVHEAESLPYGGTWHGPQGFADLMRAVGAAFEDFVFTPIGVVGNATDTVAFRGRVSGRTARGTFDMPIVEYWTCRDGKVVDILAVYHDTKRLAELCA
jgi:uncharacterized protein